MLLMFLRFQIHKKKNNMKIMIFLLYFEIRTNCKQKQFKKSARQQSSATRKNLSSFQLKVLSFESYVFYETTFKSRLCSGVLDIVRPIRSKLAMATSSPTALSLATVFPICPLVI